MNSLYSKSSKFLIRNALNKLVFGATCLRVKYLRSHLSVSPEIPGAEPDAARRAGNSATESGWTRRFRSAQGKQNKTKQNICKLSAPLGPGQVRRLHVTIICCGVDAVWLRHLLTQVCNSDVCVCERERLHLIITCLFLFLFFPQSTAWEFRRTSLKCPRALTAATCVVCGNRIGSRGVTWRRAAGRSRPVQRRVEPRAFTFVSEMSAGRWVGRADRRLCRCSPASRLLSSETLKD